MDDAETGHSWLLFPYSHQYSLPVVGAVVEWMKGLRIHVLAAVGGLGLVVEVDEKLMRKGLTLKGGQESFSLSFLPVCQFSLSFRSASSLLFFYFFFPSPMTIPLLILVPTQVFESKLKENKRMGGRNSFHSFQKGRGKGSAQMSVTNG